MEGKFACRSIIEQWTMTSERVLTAGA